MTVSSSEKKAGWGVIAMLGAAQFIMVLDTTVMNVSITQIVEDLNTTIVGLQSAITIYTLVMAAFMLLGSKLGDRWGIKRGYIFGMLVYGLGSFITAISPNLTVHLVGWSFIEGFGAVLVIPAGRPRFPCRSPGRPQPRTAATSCRWKRSSIGPGPRNLISA